MRRAAPGPAVAAVRGGPTGGPTLEHEGWLWARGYSRVAGLDEAGRGALAGPLVAAAVVLRPTPENAVVLAGVRDSKLLTPRQRSVLAERVRHAALATGVGLVSAALVDAVGLSAAGWLAFRRALAALPEPVDFLLLDAFRLPAAPVPQLPLVHGDVRCLSIAAASVLAKVTRDQLMEQVHARYPQYAFHRHKGYATAAHRAALARVGPCPEHRRSYAPVRALC